MDQNVTLSETWKPIPGFEGYDVSSHGRVRSWLNNRYGPGDTARILKLQTRSDGRLAINLRYGMQLVHRLVLLTFVGPCPPGMEARHLDGDCTNNFPENLAWGTHVENEQDKLRHGAHHNVNKTHCPQGHEYTDYRNKHNNGRVCQICMVEHRRRWAEKNRGAA